MGEKGHCECAQFLRPTIAHRILRGCPLAFLGLQKDDVQECAQNELVSLLKSKAVKAHPLSGAYVATLIKQIIKLADQNGVNIHDGLYECLGDAMAQPSDTAAYKHYVITSSIWIYCQESTAFVSHGTTGLKTWPAALFFIEWARGNKPPLLTSSSTLLELGCGTGLLSMTLAALWKPRCIISTDRSLEALLQCTSNCKLNGWNKLTLQYTLSPLPSVPDKLTVDPPFLQEKDDGCRCPEENGSLTLECDPSPLETNSHSILKRDIQDCDPSFKTSIEIQRLSWTDCDDNQMSVSQRADIVFGADIVFDLDIIPHLVEVIHTVLNHNKESRAAYIASTIRNPSTYANFVQAVQAYGLSYSELSRSSSVQDLVDDLSCPIVLCSITHPSH
eukprot:gene8123-10118_t